MQQRTVSKFMLGKQRISFIFLGEIFGDISLKYSRQFILDYFLRSKTHFSLGFDLERKRNIRQHIEDLSCAQVVLAVNHPEILSNIKKEFTPQDGLSRPHFTADQQLEMFKKFLESEPNHNVDLALHKAKIAMGIFDDNTIDFLKDVEARTSNAFCFADYSQDPETGIPYRIAAQEIVSQTKKHLGKDSGTIVLFTGIRNTSYFAAALADHIRTTAPNFDSQITTALLSSEYSADQFCDINELLDQERKERLEKIPSIGKLENLIPEFNVFVKDHGEKLGFDFRDLMEFFELCQRWQDFIPEIHIPLPLSDIKGAARKDKLINLVEFSEVNDKNTNVKFSYSALTTPRFLKALGLIKISLEMTEEMAHKIAELERMHLGVSLWSSTHESAFIYHKSNKIGVENILNTQYSLFRS